MNGLLTLTRESNKGVSTFTYANTAALPRENRSIWNEGKQAEQNSFQEDGT